MTFNVRTNKVQLDSMGIYRCKSNHKKEPFSSCYTHATQRTGKCHFTILKLQFLLKLKVKAEKL